MKNRDRWSNVFLNTLLVSLMFMANLSYAIWSFTLDTPGGTTGNIDDTNWKLNVSFTLSDPDLLTITSVGTIYNEAFLNLADSIDGGRKIVAINNAVFQNKNNIISVTLPNTLEYIGNNAFENCTGLLDVNPFLPKSVTYIGDWAFRSCSALANDLVLWSQDLKVVGNNAFRDSKNIPSVDMGHSGVTRLEEYSFLKTGLTNVILREGLEFIGNGVFEDCSKIVSVEPFLPSTVVNIGTKAFYHCTPITNALVLLSKNLKVIGSEAFNGLGNMKSLDLGNSGITRLEDYAFLNTGLTNVILSEGLEFIGGGVFESCSQIVNVEPFLPSTVMNIGQRAFYNCAPVTNALVLSSPDLKVIGSEAFRFDSNIKSLDLENSGVTTLNSYSFLGTGITNLILREGLEYIGNGVFEGCPKLVNVEPFLPSTVAYIGQSAFRQSGAITNALVLSSKNLEIVGDSSFIDDVKIPSVDMSKSGVKRIRNDSFAGATGLVELKLSDCLEIVEYGSFLSCRALENIELFFPSTVTNIGNYAFKDCNKLATPLVLGSNDSVTIGNDAFISTKIPTVFFGVGATNLNVTSMFGGLNPKVPITNVWFCGDLPIFGSDIFRDVYSSDFLGIFYIPSGNSSWNSFISGLTPLTDGTENSSDDELQDFKNNFPNVKATPIGKFIPPGSSKYQYVCKWRPPYGGNKGTVIIIK